MTVSDPNTVVEKGKISIPSIPVLLASIYQFGKFNKAGSYEKWVARCELSLPIIEMSGLILTSPQE